MSSENNCTCKDQNDGMYTLPCGEVLSESKLKYGIKMGIISENTNHHCYEYGCRYCNEHVTYTCNSEDNDVKDDCYEHNHHSDNVTTYHKCDEKCDDMPKHVIVYW